MSTSSYQMIDGFSDPVLLLNEHGYILYSNPATETVTGFTNHQLQGKKLEFFYSNGNDPLRVEYELNTAKKRGKFISAGWRPRADGSSFWSEMTISYGLKLAGQENGFNCIIRDISETKQLELDLRASEQQYRLMVQEAKDYAIFMLDKNGHVKSWNEGARLIHGYLESEILGKHMSRFYTEEDLKVNKPQLEIEAAIKDGRYEGEGWRLKKDGSVFWANVVITALYNEANQFMGLSKLTRDLTERKLNEEALRQSELRYRSLVEQVKDYGIFLMDEKGRIISWNEGARRIKGYEAEEIIGKYFTIFYPEEELVNGKPAYELKVARVTGQYEEEGWRLRKDGSRFWANIVITAVYNNQGNLIGFSKVTRDLTERMENEKALRDSYEKYRELAGKLRLSNMELASANEELEQFTYIVSHDLQEPIRTIKSFLKLIELKLDTKEYEQLHQYIDKAVNTATRMRELIQNLLSYSQLSKIEVEKKEVSVKQVLHETFENLKILIRESGAVIKENVYADNIHCDRVQIVQLLQNLISNAIKFTDKDKPEVSIDIKFDNGHPLFAISDNGIGISAEDEVKVFEIFRRLHTEKEYAGTGIGLAICKKIVERHQGRIWLKSEPGIGTTFYFTLNEHQVAGTD